MQPFPTLNIVMRSRRWRPISAAHGANSFAPDDPEVVASIIDDLGGAAEEISIWDSVFSDAQAKRGATAYRGSRGRCHFGRLDGAPDDADIRPSPTLAHAKFAIACNWDGTVPCHRFTNSLRATDAASSNRGYMDA